MRPVRLGSNPMTTIRGVTVLIAETDTVRDAERDPRPSCRTPSLPRVDESEWFVLGWFKLKLKIMEASNQTAISAFLVFSRFLVSEPSENHSAKMQLRTICRYSRAEISHGDPVREKNHFRKSRPTNDQHLFKKSTSYWAPAQSTRTKMTANGFSSYELFVKKCDSCCILQ